MSRFAVSLILGALALSGAGVVPRALVDEPPAAIAAETPAVDAPPAVDPSLTTDAAPAALDFFERRVRPLLVEHCQACHGADEHEAGLRLDSAAALRRGSTSGPVVLAGDSGHSPLIVAIGYSGAIRMPPDGRLPGEAIAVLTSWVDQGAVWPDKGEPGESSDPADPTASPTADATAHWAFQPLADSPPPDVLASHWPQTPVDSFIMARLEAAGLQPRPPADRATLLRRATYDLIGLPPTPAEVADFLADPSPCAFEKVVERLLASPRYGERWGRHWLDVARYADTKGYVRLQDNPSYPAAWTYRDYVIRAWNEDLPFDRFVIEQLAADRLLAQAQHSQAAAIGGNHAADVHRLAALGFLTLGQRFINSQPDILDDRIDVVTRGLLGLTVACARCHDHKFDPIPTADYYSLHGVFANSLEPRVPPLLLTAAEQPPYAAYLQELHAKSDQFAAFLESQRTRLSGDFRAKAAEYLLAAQREQVQANFLAVMFLIDAAKELNPAMIQRWGRLLLATRPTPAAPVSHPALAAWHALARLEQDEFPAQVAGVLSGLVANGNGVATVNPYALAALTRDPPQNLSEAAARFGELFAQAENLWQQTRAADPHATCLEDPAWEQIRGLLYGPDAPCDVALADVEEFLFVDTTTQNQFHAQQRQVEDWIASPGAAPHAHTLEDAAQLVEPRIFLRGNSSNPGPTVPRQFLKILSPAARQPFTDGSGRRELAEAIVAAKNPLTPRVIVNRLWLHHFGAGLVRTPSDFGLRGEPPTHPQLLDYLASRLQSEGWSLKRMQRLLMLSAVYQQTSNDDAAAHARDPENRLRWRMNRRRLEWEALRDALFAVSGRLDITLGGPPFALSTEPAPARRAVYALVDRQNLPGVLRTFDFPAPDASNPQRHRTTVPQQALFLMNGPFLEQLARAVADRADLQGLPDDGQRIRVVYRLLFAREPAPAELELGLAYLQGTSAEDPMLPEGSPLTSSATESEGQATADGASEPVSADPAASNPTVANPLAETAPAPTSGEPPPAAPVPFTAWQEYVQALLLSNEFTFVD